MFLDSTDKICLKDISQAMVTEMTGKLSVDPDTQEQFCESLGLNPECFHHSQVLNNFRGLFPDTPVKLLKDIFEALQLYDLIELLEKALKLRSLRPALPLKEIEKLPNRRNRPTTLCSKVSVLIVDINTKDSSDNAEQIESFFKFLDSRNEVTTTSAKRVVEIAKILEEKMRRKKEMEWKDTNDRRREASLMTRLARQETKLLQQAQVGQRNPTVDRTTSESPPRETEGIQLKRLAGQESQLKKELEEVTARREQWAKEGKPSIEMTIKQKKDELQKEKEKFKMDLSTTLTKWKGNKGWIKLRLIS